MDLVDAMRSTPTVRYYLTDDVPDDVVYRVLDSARFAPSGGNRQGWHVVVVRDPATRDAIAKLYQACWAEYTKQITPGAAAQDFAAHYGDVPVLLVVCVEIVALARTDATLERPSIVGGASVYTFVQNVLLAARNEGLGGALTTVGIAAEPELRRLLDIPEGTAVAAMLTLGWPDPARQLTKLKRKPVEHFTSVDSFNGPGLRP